MVYVHMAEGFEELEAIAIIDVLRRGGISTKMIGLGGRTVRGAHGVEMVCDEEIQEADYAPCQMIVLPGGLPGTTNLMENQLLKTHIQSFVKMGRWVGAICAAPMILGAMGIMEDRQGTIYPGMEEHLPGCQVLNQGVVVSDKVITGKGPGYAVEFALALVSALKGPGEKERIAGEMCLS